MINNKNFNIEKYKEVLIEIFFELDKSCTTQQAKKKLTKIKKNISKIKRNKSNRNYNGCML